ncbi:MAG TPA: IS110 family transposase [Candidatus Eisenbacteria bacterium]|nr:IS110 family transposase [Candidatus Eisenbacteria bacterium]
MDVKTVGIDLGKNVFHVVGLDERGAITLKRRLTRTQLAVLMANLPRALVGMEACPGSHHMARRLEEHGHTVRLLPPQYVRPYVKTNKNDFRDAEAIAEAVGRGTMRFVPPKTVAQLDLQARHRVRDRLVGHRTALVNQIRAFLLEQGLPMRPGRLALRSELRRRLATAPSGISPSLACLLAQLSQEWEQLEDRIERVTEEITALAHREPACQRLMAVPGIGPISATAIVAAVGNGSGFTKGRDFAAWLGLVPRQNSTGGRPRLLGVSKHGNTYLRRLMVLGAQAVMRSKVRERQRFGPWLQRLELRVHRNVAVIALANKLARIAWSVLAKAMPYRPFMEDAA